MTGIVEMFAELSEPDFYDVSAQLELFAWRRRARIREHRKTWRLRNPDKARELQRRYAANRYARDPVFRAKETARKVRRYQSDPVFRESHKARMREYMAKRYAEKKAQRAA